MKVKYKNSLEYKAIVRLSRMRGSVVLRRDFNDLGSRSQTTRIFKKLVTEKKLVRISFGVYAKTYISQHTGTPLIKGGVDAAFNEALKKLKICFEPGSAEKEYIAGRTLQVPAKRVIHLKSRCRRHLGYGAVQLIFEKNINAR